MFGPRPQFLLLFHFNCILNRNVFTTDSVPMTSSFSITLSSFIILFTWFHFPEAFCIFQKINNIFYLTLCIQDISTYNRYEIINHIFYNWFFLLSLQSLVCIIYTLRAHFTSYMSGVLHIICGQWLTMREHSPRLSFLCISCPFPVKLWFHPSIYPNCRVLS